MFTGREYDEESGLYNYRARAYSPTIGRFLQRDPIGYYDSMNLFQYVGNNPVNYVDPWGLYEYDTTSWGIAFLHESNPFNTDSAMRQQMYSWGNFYTGNWAEAAATSGQAAVEKTNSPCKDSWWQKIYTGAQATAASATAIAILIDLSIVRIVDTRRALGADGAKSQIIKISNRWTKKTLQVIHRVIKNGKIVHQHNKFP